MYEVVPGAMPREMGELEQATSEDGRMNDRFTASANSCVQASSANDVQDSPRMLGCARCCRISLQVV